MFVLFQSTTPDQTDLLEAYGSDGELVWSHAETQPWRIVRDPTGGAIVCGGFFTDPYKINAAGERVWTWTRPDSNALTWDAAPDRAGGAYLLFPWNDETLIYHVNNAGVDTLLASLTPAALGMSMVQAESLALSADGSVLFALVVDPADEDTIDLVGVSTADGSILWQKQLANDAPSTFEELWYMTVRVLPGADAVIVGYTGVSGSDGVATVQRLDFPSGVTSAPIVTWTAIPGGVGPYLYALDVTSDSVLAGYEAAGINHALSCLDASDGGVRWRLSGANFESDWTYVEPHSLAAAQGVVLVGIGSDSVSFPNEWYGYKLLDVTTGDEVVRGAFPFEVFLTGAVAALGRSAELPAGDPRDRLRSFVSEDLGSILEAVEIVPVDASFSEHFTEAVSLEPSVRQRFRELFRDTHSDDVDFSYYPRPRQNTMSENQYDGITILSRLAAWYPPRFYGAVTDLGIPNDNGVATASQVIEALLSQWSSLQSWLQLEPVPDLRLPLGKKPSEYGPTDGLVTVEAVTIAQEPERRVTALDILQDLLSPFPGTVLRQNSEGKLVIIPVYGPDADEEPVVKLRDVDLYSLSTGKPDPFSTINRVTFTSSGGQERNEQAAVMQPAWFQIGSNYRLGDADAWFTPPGGRLNLQPPKGDDTTLQESLSSGQFGLQKPILWPISSAAIPAGAGVGLKDDNGDPTITAAYRIFNPSGDLAGSGSATVTIISNTVPFTGEWVNAFSVSFDLYSLTMRARWNEAAGGVEWAIGPAQMEGNCVFGCWSAIVEFTLDDSSTGFTESTTDTSVTFGLVENGDSIPAEDGGNAIEASQEAFGVRERTIHVRGYQLDLTTLTAAARGFLLHNITPRVTREVELAVAAQGVTFDTIGRLVQLPNGETGILVGLDYSDDHTTLAWSKTARVQLTDPSAPGAVPPTWRDNTLETTSGQVITVAGFGAVPLMLTIESEE